MGIFPVIRFLKDGAVIRLIDQEAELILVNIAF